MGDGLGRSESSRLTRERNVMPVKEPAGYGSGHKRSDSESSSHRLYGAASVPAPGLSSSGGSMEFPRANSYTDKSGLDNDSRFKTQQRIRGLQLELAEKQVALLQEQDKRLEAEQRLLVSIDHSKRAAAINQFVFKANARLQQEMGDMRSEVDRLRKDKIELYAAFKAVSEKVEADLLEACAAAPEDVRPHLEVALQGPLELLRASGGIDDRSSTPTQVSDALSVLKLAPGTPAETEESTDRIPSPSDSVSISSVRSGVDAGAPPAGGAGTAGSGPMETPLSGLTVEQIESLGDMGDFQATDTMLQKMVEGVDLLVGPNGLETGGLDHPRRPLSPRPTPPPRRHLQTMDSIPSASCSREIFPAPSSPPATRAYVHRRSHSQSMTRSSSGSNIYPPASAPSNYRYAPPASRAMAAHSYVPAGRTRSMTPACRTRSNDIDDPYDGLTPPELHRATSNNTMSTPPPRRLLSPHQGVRRRSETPGKEVRTFSPAPNTPSRQEPAPTQLPTTPSPIKEAPAPGSPAPGSPGSRDGDPGNPAAPVKAGVDSDSGTDKADAATPKGKSKKRSWFAWTKSGTQSQSS